MLDPTLERLGAEGCCLLEGIIPFGEVERIRADVATTIRHHTRLPLPQGYVTGFLRVNQSLAPHLAHPRILGIVRALFGEHARISMLTGIINGPGIPRGEWHADWPFNQSHRSRVAAPYPDVVMNLVTMWMLTDFTEANGGTLYLPGSHRLSNSPRKDGGAIDPVAALPFERQLLGRAGDVGVFDARTWHAVAPKRTSEERVAVIVRYAPWWLNLNPLRPGTRDRLQIIESAGAADIQVEPIPQDVYERLPPDIQPLVFHMVE
jgi:hypothetical protein